MNAVIYARYSSHSQTEQSIEGQLKVCKEYAERKGYTIIDKYIDRATTGTNDKRPQFQKMLRDSSKNQFQFILVYKLDRFARSVEDSVTFGIVLKRNNVELISATENIDNTPMGKMVKNFIHAMDAYYSDELSVKIRRGMDISASKGLSLGGNITLGYYIDEDKKFQIHRKDASIVTKIFQMYAGGKKMAEIIHYLNDNQIKTSNDTKFNQNSIRRILTNKRYIGHYTYRGTEAKGLIPPIISDLLFEDCQKILDKNKKAPARAKADVEYILTTKLFCGQCNSPMTGISGTGKARNTYYYYKCVNRHKQECTKKTIRKEKIEDLVVAETKDVLTDKFIDAIARKIMAQIEKEMNDDSNLKHWKRELKNTEKAIENLLIALEQGEIVDIIAERITQKKVELADLKRQIANESMKRPMYTVEQIKRFLRRFKSGDINDLTFRKSLVDTFINKVELLDEKMTIYYNVEDSHSPCLYYTRLVELQGLEPRTNRL